MKRTGRPVWHSKFSTALLPSPAYHCESLKPALTANSTSMSCIGTRRLKTTRQIRAAPSCTAAGGRVGAGVGIRRGNPKAHLAARHAPGTQVQLTCHHELLAYDI